MIPDSHCCMCWYNDVRNPTAFASDFGIESNNQLMPLIDNRFIVNIQNCIVRAEFLSRGEIFHLCAVLCFCSSDGRSSFISNTILSIQIFTAVARCSNLFGSGLVWSGWDCFFYWHASRKQWLALAWHRCALLKEITFVELSPLINSTLAHLEIRSYALSAIKWQYLAPGTISAPTQPGFQSSRAENMTLTECRSLLREWQRRMTYKSDSSYRMTW